MQTVLLWPFAQIETNFRESVALFYSELPFDHGPPDANIGVDGIVETQRPFALRHNVSFGDL